MKDSTKGFLLLTCAAILWGAIGPISKYIFTTGVTPLETAFWRGTIAGGCYLIHFARRRCQKTVSARGTATEFANQIHPYSIYRPHIFGIVVFGVFGVALLEGSYVFAVEEGGAALASILLYSAPIWVNLYSRFVLKESVTMRQWTALGFTTIGILGVSILGGINAFSTKAIAFGLCSGLSYAAFYVAGKIFFTRSNPVSVYVLAFPVASLALLPVIYLHSNLSPLDVILKLSHLELLPLLALLSVGVFSTYFPYICHGAGLKIISAGKASIIASLEPVIAVCLAQFFWAESFSTIGYFFIGLVLLGISM